MQNPRITRLKRIFNFSGTLILIASLAVAAYWVVAPKTFNMEPLLVLLGLLYAAVPLVGRWLVAKMSRQLRKEELTLSFALAWGYLNNYLSPVIKRLRSDLANPDNLKFLVYMPRILDELKKDAINETITELTNKGYEVKTVELDFAGEKRKIDFRTAKKLKTGTKSTNETKYFDFPTTLLTLEQAVEFKLETKEGKSPKAQKESIGSTYIRDFRDHLETMLQEVRNENIRKNIRIVDGGADFLDRPETPPETS